MWGRGGRGIWEISVPSSQFCCKPVSTLGKNIQILKEGKRRKMSFLFVPCGVRITPTAPGNSTLDTQSTALSRGWTCLLPGLSHWPLPLYVDFCHGICSQRESALFCLPVHNGWERKKSDPVPSTSSKNPATHPQNFNIIYKKATDSFMKNDSI